MTTSTFAAIAPVCQNTVSPVLPTNSTNIPAITGTWTPSTVSTATAGTTIYTFVPDLNQCASTQTMSIIVNPIPVLVITDPAPVCYPGKIDLTNANVTVGSIGTDLLTYWSSLTPLTPMNTPTSIPASATYYITATTLLGCSSGAEPVYVIVNSLPIAAFTPSPSLVPSYYTQSTMLNSSTNAVSYQWNFGDETAGSSETSPLHDFPYDVDGSYLVRLIATSEFGCIDTTYETVIVKEELIYYVPNTFTPDGNGDNDIFLPVFSSGYDPYDYSLLIFNRWGEIIFESHDAKVGWNGSYGVGGNLVQNGTYTWKIEYKAKLSPQRKMIVGHVNVYK